MKNQNSGVSADGRKPPPPQSQFRKGQSGNRAGRPKGSVSLSAITRRVALKMHTVPIEGKPRKLTLLELLILKTKSDGSGRSARSCPADELAEIPNRAFRNKRRL